MNRYAGYGYYELQEEKGYVLFKMLRNGDRLEGVEMPEGWELGKRRGGRILLTGRVGANRGNTQYVDVKWGERLEYWRRGSELEWDLLVLREERTGTAEWVWERMRKRGEEE